MNEIIKAENTEVKENVSVEKNEKLERSIESVCDKFADAFRKLAE